ncbi:TetR/AcrR family transcriptional regulator [Loktanella sp. SALINAS62]|uniref:TetR/AcrR family transcriptional regulator n=1 Tax=Loktanella sp. SALINAS62 TaxID=2706124 RepID=UPI001B8B76ED|nr:TetR/AcrR family transcriptional regulator [Loktanella sp. SALINAS62]MBS1301998.1 TetR/AcrR family transcriptional regulator [Loktanella sp. SALINAS62]
MKETESPSRKTGRPLSFDRKDVLEKAMLAFWGGGYETTSITDLTAAMGVTAPSLYAAFGNKQQLFLEAVRLYAGDHTVLEQTMAVAPTARDAVAQMLRGAAILYTGETTPPGCLLASSAATGSPDAAYVRDAVAAERRKVRNIVIRRIELDIAKGLMASHTCPATLADLTLAVTQGMSVLARDGADRARLLAIADAATTGWNLFKA